MDDDSLFYRQLAGGPLRWRRWGREAVGEAARSGEPMLLFCGDSLDHWTAAMAAELSSDVELCALIGQEFVPVAADVCREPALAKRVQECLALTAGGSGVPAMAFATPDGAPFGAVPFRPMRDRGGEKGLARIALEVAQQWRDDPRGCAHDADRVADAIGATYALLPGDGSPLRESLVLANAESQAMELADPLNGGFGPPPRHPHPALLEFLIARCARDDAPLALTRHTERTLAALAAGGLHDHLGGGFFRASADESWTVPFFEKRLGDNAQLALAYLRAHRVFGRAYYREIAEDALRFSLHALRRDDGLFAYGTHAGSRDRGGRVHAGAAVTWTPDEIAAVVGQDGAELVCGRFGVSAEGDIPGDGADRGRSVLAVRAELPPEEMAALPQLMRRLAVARAEREPPPRDDSAYAQGNGMLLAALVAAAAPADADPLFAEAADALRALLAYDPPALSITGTAGHAWRAHGLACWQRWRGSTGPGSVGDSLEMVLHHGIAANRPGNFLVEDERATPMLRPSPLDAEDSDSGPSAAAVFARTAISCGRIDDARGIVAAHAGLLRRAPLACAGLCLALEELCALEDR